jgi:hypothetical protein
VIVIHFFINVLIVAIELALIAGVGWLAWKLPIVFAAVSAVVALLIGLQLELRRLAFEMPFYFEQSKGLNRFARGLVGCGHAVMKAVLAAIIALMTFAGTDDARLQLVAALFAVCVLAGSTLLRRMTISWGARPAHWGFFRMSVPLGLLFSGALTFFPPPTSLDVARKVLLDLPARPGIAQAGEALFSFRLWIDDLIVRALSAFVGPSWAQAIGIAIGSNVLVGVVIALYAVTISEMVRVMEEAHWRLRGLALSGASAR